MRRGRLIGLVLFGLVSAACGDGPVAETRGPATTADTPVVTPVDTTADTTVPATDTTPPDVGTTDPGAGSDGVRRVRIFDVDGVEVVTLIETAELPEQASRVEFASTVIDTGDGPEVCIGAVNDSLPPQCGGVVADGLDMTGWGQVDGGVLWGERNVTVTWPPVDGHVESLADSAIRPPESRVGAAPLPDECAGIERFVDSRAVNTRSADIGERSGGVYLTDDGTIVLQVTDDPEPHREALARGGAEACVIRVARSEAELFRLQDELVSELDTLFITSIATGSTGRLDLTVPVADAATARRIADLVDEPEAVRIIGEAIILRP